MEIFNFLKKTISIETPIAHIWYEESFNFGDSAIWLAQCKILEDLKLNIMYECNDSNYDENLMEQKIGINGVVLLRGGGNFNHIYSYHLLRLKIINKFKNNLIIQLPQSIHFKDLTSDIFLTTKQILEQHNNLIIMARDKYSRDFMNLNMPKVLTLLFPDISSYLDLSNHIKNYNPSNDILWLLRIDSETKLCIISDNSFIYPPENVCKLSNIANIDTYKYKIMNINFSHQCLTSNTDIYNNSKIPYDCKRIPKCIITDWYLCHLLDPDNYNKLSFREKSEIGFIYSIKLLQQAKIIITDRLHSYLIASYLHIPQIIIDNNNNKLTNYINTWGRSPHQTFIADCPENAYKIAINYLQTTKINQYATFTFENRYLKIFSDISNIIINKNIKILSFGCSIGDECLTLKNVFPDATIYGTDIRNDLEEICLSKNINFIKYNDLTNYKFDVIFCMSVLCNHPFLQDKKNSSIYYPFSLFNENINLIHSILNVDGYFILHRCSYKFSDCSIFNQYQIIPMDVIEIDKFNDDIKKFNKDGTESIEPFNDYLFKKLKN